jgi:hypothetical protein
MFHAYYLIIVPRFLLAQMNNALSHSAGKNGSESPFSVVPARHVPDQECAYFLIDPN